jgi:3-dehydroquinate dehydratase
MSLIYHLGKSETSDGGVKDLVKDLETCIETLKNITEITNKTKSTGRSFSEAELFKKIEDGILDSIHKANEHQLNVLLNGGYRFKYYIELNDAEKCKIEIQKRLRDSKLNELLK